MPEAPVPAPKSPNHPTNIVRNILVGAVTTILGSTAVYFITNKTRGGNSDMEEMLLTKQSTIDAWKSYVTFENVYAKKELSLIKDLTGKTLDFTEFVSQGQEESDKFKKSIDELKSKKHIDKDFIQMLNSRLVNEDAGMKTLEKYSQFMKAMQDTSLPYEEKMSLTKTQSALWVSQSKGYTERALADIEDIAKILSERYGTTFSLTDLIVYNMAQKDSLSNRPGNPGPDPVKPDPVVLFVDTTSTATPSTAILTGHWSANPPNGADIDLAKTGKFFWHVLSTGDHVSGTWKLLNGKLYMYFVNDESGKKGNWIFNLTAFKPDSFFMTVTNTNPIAYRMVRQVPKP